ncbi:MAG: hypothetical protein M3450_00595 [Actinomycetota bacterium]|nr:hypothetical protein [Actinomycetota bacterium]MDQ3639984.1 hypothetical protein [Actinomycetota bacterium]
MTARVSPTERIRAEIDELIAGAERGSLLEASDLDLEPHPRLRLQAAHEPTFRLRASASVTRRLGARLRHRPCAR